jgi:hypothetical protein
MQRLDYLPGLDLLAFGAGNKTCNRGEHPITNNERSLPKFLRCELLSMRLVISIPSNQCGITGVRKSKSQSR